ncbi:MAG: hypothetical protein M3159_08345 [Actinomycetota bacterium]|nr:hypothetical protein [Actinomycetota bacterium]
MTPQGDLTLPAPATPGGTGETRLATTSFTRTTTSVPLWIGFVLIAVGIVIVASAAAGRAVSRRLNGLAT